MTYKEALSIAMEYLAKAVNYGCFTFRFKRDEAKLEEAVHLLYRLEDELPDSNSFKEGVNKSNENKDK